MSRKIVQCPACKKAAVRYSHGIVCAHCGYGHTKLDLDVQAEVPKGKIKVDPPDLKALPLFGRDSTKRKQLKLL